MQTSVITVVLAVVASVSVAMPSAAGELPPGGTFIDDNGNTHEPMIEAIAAVGITEGCTSSGLLYCPSDSVTRGQMASFLARAFNLSPASVDYFEDDSGNTHEDNINAIAEAGITLGFADGTFKPGVAVSRQQMATFLARALGLDPVPGDRFDDVVNTPHEENINAIAQAGITLGCDPDGLLFCPRDDVRRDQMASFLGRALGLDPIVPPPPVLGELTIMFIAVRQGDAALYQGPCGEVGLIDANRFRSIEVLAAMDSLGGRDLAWVSSSHYDADHLGAIVDVVTAPGVTVGAAYDRGGDRNVKDTDTYRDYYDWVTTAGIRQSVDIGDTFSLCEGPQQVTFTVLSAGTDGTAINGLAVTEENDRGLCLRVDYLDFDLVTCGDINGTNDGSRTDVESPVGVVVGDVEVVKVNHHGSDYSSNQTFVSALSAEVSVISVGKNSFGHPAASVVARWETIGDVYVTQSSEDNALIDGTITIATDGISGLTVTTETSGTAIEYPLDEE